MPAQHNDLRPNIAGSRHYVHPIFSLLSKEFINTVTRKLLVFFIIWQKEEERLKASVKRESQQRRMREKAHGRGMSSSYLEGGYEDEDDEDDATISLSAIKKSYKQGAKRGIYYHTDLCTSITA